MDIELFRDFCLSKKGVTEEFPFDEDTLVFKVMGKIFVLTDVDTFKSINLKCDPLWAIELRETYAAIIPGFHMNKKHWNTVSIDGSLSDTIIKKLINHSYNRVVDNLPKGMKVELEKIN